MDEDLQQLEARLGVETARLRTELAELDRLGERFGTTISRAFASAIVDGRKFSDVMRQLLLSLSEQALAAALKPIGDLVGNLITGILPNAKGSVVTPFAQGGVVNSPL